MHFRISEREMETERTKEKERAATRKKGAIRTFDIGELCDFNVA